MMELVWLCIENIHASDADFEEFILQQNMHEFVGSNKFNPIYHQYMHLPVVHW